MAEKTSSLWTKVPWPFTQVFSWAVLWHAISRTKSIKFQETWTVLFHKTPIVCRQDHAEDSDLHGNRAGLKDLPGESYLGFQDQEELVTHLLFISWLL